MEQLWLWTRYGYGTAMAMEQLWLWNSYGYGTAMVMEQLWLVCSDLHTTPSWPPANNIDRQGMVRLDSRCKYME